MHLIRYERKKQPMFGQQGVFVLFDENNDPALEVMFSVSSPFNIEIEMRTVGGSTIVEHSFPKKAPFTPKIMLSLLDYMADHLGYEIDRRMFQVGEWKEGESCGHLGCLSHVSNPCESCGRIAGSWELTAKYWKERYLNTPEGKKELRRRNDGEEENG